MECSSPFRRTPKADIPVLCRFLDAGNDDLITRSADNLGPVHRVGERHDEAALLRNHALPHQPPTRRMRRGASRKRARPGSNHYITLPVALTAKTEKQQLYRIEAIN